MPVSSLEKRREGKKEKGREGKNMVHVSAWTACNVWAYDDNGNNYRITKAGGKWYIAKEVKAGKQWDFITTKAYDDPIEAHNELIAMVSNAA